MAKGKNVGRVSIGVDLEVDQSRARQQITNQLNQTLKRGWKASLDDIQFSGGLSKTAEQKIQNEIKKAANKAGLDIDETNIRIRAGDLGQRLKKDINASLKKGPQLDLGTANALRGAESLKVQVRKLLADVDKEVRKPRPPLLGRFEESIEGSLGRIGLNVRSLATLLGAGITGSLVVAGFRILAGAIAETARVARDMNQAIAASTSVFGPASKNIVHFAETSRAALFLTKQEAIEAANELGFTARSMGATGAQAAVISQALLTTVSNLSAIRGSSEDVTKGLTAVREALKGDTEDLIRLGLVVSEFTIKQEAMRLGIIKSGEQLTAQNKALITSRIILQEGARVQGEAAKQAQTAAGSQRNFTREVENAKESIGQSLLPALADLAQGLAATIKLARLAGSAIADIFPDRKPDAEAAAKLAAQQAKEAKAVKEAEDAITKVINEQASARQRLQRLQSNPNIVLDVLAAEERVKTSLTAVERAQISLEQSQHALNLARRQGERDANNLAQAEIAVKQASIRTEQSLIQETRAFRERDNAYRDLKRTQEDLADLPILHEFQDIQSALDLEQAERNLNKTLREQAKELKNLRNAFEDIEDAYDKFARASRSAAASQRDIRDARRGILDAEDKLAEQQFNIEGQPLDKAQAELSLRRARFEASRLDNQQLRETQDLNDRLLDARLRTLEVELNVRSASLDVQSARLAETAAALSLKDAQDQVAASATNLRSAELSVVEAEHAVRGAVIEAALASADLEAAQKTLKGEFQSVEERTAAFIGKLGELTGTVADGGVKDQLGQLSGLVSGNAASYRDAVQATQEYIDIQDRLQAKLENQKKSAKDDVDTDWQDLLEKATSFLLKLSNPILALPGINRFFSPRAAGGAVMRGNPYWANETQGELFIPSSHGTIKSGETTRNIMASAQPANVTLNVDKVVDVDENVLARQLSRHINRHL